MQPARLNTKLANLYNGAALQAMNQLGSLFFVKDTERRFVLCTDALVHHLGYQKADQILGLRDEDISPEYLVEHYRQYDEGVLESGTRVVELVELVRNVDGSYDWFSTTKWPLYDDQGQIVGLAGVVKSLLPRHTMEDDLLPLTPAVELIAQEYHRKLTVEDLAQAAAMSPSHFARQFKIHFGTTPNRYLRSVRLMAVCELLSTTDLPLTAIAHQTGYYDQSHMSNEFNRDRGVTPSTYRREHRHRSLHKATD
jgi:PAS domain S-box